MDLALENIDPNTGEVMNFEPELEHEPDDPMDKWGERVKEMLAGMTYKTCGRYWQKKRFTLVALADAVLMGKPKNTVWLLPQACTYVSYYRWMASDPLFAAANDYMIGPINPKGANATPSRGIAHDQRDTNMLEAEDAAISALSEARTMLRIASAEAVATLREALVSADIRGHAQWRERIMAATAILDRADADTASRQPAALNQINNAIMMIYNEGERTTADVITADLDDVIEGVISESAATGKQHDMHSPISDRPPGIWTKAEQKRLLALAREGRASQANGK